MKKLMIVAAAILLGACTDESGARRALNSQGLTPVKVGGYALWACSKDDDFATKFTARNARGETVTGAVCSGWLKGNTIRFD